MKRKSLQYLQARQSGIALVLVLAMLVLLSGVMVAFLTAARTETSASKAFADQVDARQAADTAVNFVIGQIRDATTSPADGASQDSSKSGPSFTWVSQPGAIRTYGANEGTVYKLYSASEMRESEAAFKQSALLDAGDQIPEDQEDNYVDLNEPTLAALSIGETPEDTRYEARYPIVNPYGKFPYNIGSKTFNLASTGPGAIEGFTCEPIRDQRRRDAEGAEIPLLPMKVRWLYILKDGSLAALNAQGKIENATAANPPVARTAFWTDDDSSKININTSTEGTYWDVPSVGTRQESGDANGPGTQQQGGVQTPKDSLNLAVAQPARNEFQRYPGHPATTSLSPALRWLFAGYKPYLARGGLGGGSNIGPMEPDVDFKEAIYRMAPRVVGGPAGKNPDSQEHNGTSLGGTSNTDRQPGANDNPLKYKPIAIDQDRLYATLDEYFFRPDRTGRDQQPVYQPHGGQEVPNTDFVPDHVDKLRFFLTASSRAPELNHMGRPRVTVWPIHATEVKQTAFDDIFAFCSTLGEKEYYFTRANPRSATEDFAGSPDNQRVFSYLQDAMGRNIPWIGSSYVSKYTKKNSDQMLTQIFDYIRSTNLVDTSTTKTGELYGASYTPFYWPDRKKQANMSEPYSGQVTPIRITHDNGSVTQGFGRFITVSEAALVFSRAAASNTGTPIPAGHFGLQAVLLLDMYTPAQGYPALRDTYSVRVRIGSVANVDLDKVPVPDGDRDWFEIRTPDVTSDPVKLFPTTRKDMFNMVTLDPYMGPIARVFMPFRGVHNQLICDPGWTNYLQWNPPATKFPPHSWDGTTPKLFRPQAFTDPTRRQEFYPFYSDTVVVKNDKTDVFMKGGTFVIDIYGTHNPTSNDLPVQTIRIKFADVLKLPVPTTASTDFQQRISKGINGQRNNLTAGNADSGYNLIKAGDTIRSYEIGGTGQDGTMGDQRLVAAVPRVNYGNGFGSGYYTPRGGAAAYAGTARMLHGLRVGRGAHYPDGTVNGNVVDDGRLVAGAPYRGDRRPKLPQGINGVKNRRNFPGDWDRGISKNVDGAFINKPDEGNINFDFNRTGGTKLPYFLGFSGFEEAGPTFFSPNRMMPSAVMFGSLPTKVLDGHAWQTLLFRPSVANGADHEGAAGSGSAYADHYLLDLFHMPVVEPYAISEPFSTAGKINLNHEIAPFGYVRKNNAPYIERTTGLHAVLKRMWMTCVDTGAAEGGHREDPLTDNARYRFPVDATATIKVIQDRMNRKGLFKTASEICEVPLVPGDNPQANAANPLSINWREFWDTRYGQTGDNQRERPYAHIYPRLTTRSNVYTVYVRAQSIKKSPKSAPDVFNPDVDQVLGEYRGQTTIERYIDPNDPALKNYDPTKDTGTDGGSADKFYRFRIVNAKQFTAS